MKKKTTGISEINLLVHSIYHTIFCAWMFPKWNQPWKCNSPFPAVRLLGWHEWVPPCPGQGPPPLHLPPWHQMAEINQNPSCLWFSLLPYQDQTRCQKAQHGFQTTNMVGQRPTKTQEVTRSYLGVHYNTNVRNLHWGFGLQPKPPHPRGFTQVLMGKCLRTRWFITESKALGLSHLGILTCETHHPIFLFSYPTHKHTHTCANTHKHTFSFVRWKRTQIIQNEFCIYYNGKTEQTYLSYSIFWQNPKICQIVLIFKNCKYVFLCMAGVSNTSLLVHKHLPYYFLCMRCLKKSVIKKIPQ